MWAGLGTASLAEASSAPEVGLPWDGKERVKPTGLQEAGSAAINSEPREGGS